MKKLKTDELDRLTVEQYRHSKKNPLILVLDNLRSLNNVGSVFRTADGFRLEGLMLCGITAKPPHREIHKTALGATESVYWEYWEKTELAVRQLIQQNYTILALEHTDKSLPLQSFNPEYSKKYALIFGNEVKGISDAVLDMADYCLEIPQFGTKHSFNVTVSAGIAVWQLLLRMDKLA